MPKICVIDDSWNIATFAYLLTVGGYDVQTAKTKEEALQKMEKEYFDVVLLDFILEGEDSFEIMKGLLKINPRVIVFLLTGYLSQKVYTMLENGVHEILEKPIRSKNVLEAIDEALRKQRCR